MHILTDHTLNLIFSALLDLSVALSLETSRCVGVVPEETQHYLAWQLPQRAHSVSSYNAGLIPSDRNGPSTPTMDKEATPTRMKKLLLRGGRGVER